MMIVFKLILSKYFNYLKDEKDLWNSEIPKRVATKSNYLKYRQSTHLKKLIINN